MQSDPDKFFAPGFHLQVVGKDGHTIINGDEMDKSHFYHGYVEGACVGRVLLRAYHACAWVLCGARSTQYSPARCPNDRGC